MSDFKEYRPIDNSPLQQDYWKLMSLMIRDALENNPNGVVLLKFEKLKQYAEHVWKEAAVTLASIVKGEGENILAPDDMLLCFNESSYILISNQKNTHTSLELAKIISKSVGLHLMGSALGSSTISIQSVLHVEGNTIEVENFSNEVFEKDKSQPETKIQANKELVGTASFDFLPIWHVRRNFVMCFECIPRWHLEDGTILDEADLSEHFSQHNMEYALDAETVHHAVDQVINVIEHDAMASILVPVHYDTVMEDQGFQKFLTSYGELMPIWRERVSMEIKCIPSTASFEDIKQALHRLRPYCYGLYLQVPFGFDKLGDYEIDGLISLGLDLTHDSRDEADILADMENFIGRISQYNNLHTHALGIKTVSLSVAAICAGFDYIGCNPIDEELDGWGLDDFLIRPVDLYKKLIKAK